MTPPPKDGERGPLWPPDRLCVYCGYRAAEFVAIIDGEQRCIDPIDCKEAREAKGIRGSKFRFKERVRP